MANDIFVQVALQAQIFGQNHWLYPLKLHLVVFSFRNARVVRIAQTLLVFGSSAVDHKLNSSKSVLLE